MTGVFEADLGRSRQVTLEAWRRRPWLERAKERLARPFASQL